MVTKHKEKPLREVLEGENLNSKLYETHAEPVGRVKGVLIKFNEERFPNFPVKEGHIAEKLSFFIDREGKRAEMELLGAFHHGRSASFKLKFSDKDGNEYGYVNIKGLGVPSSYHMSRLSKTIFRSGSTVLGLMRREDAEWDWESSELLLKNGVRTHAPIALIELDSLLTKSGKEVDVKTLRKKGQLPQDFTPVLYLRAFSEITRLDDVEFETIEKFARQRGMSNLQYVNWFADVQAKNLARMHSLGKVHGFLHMGNITIDGCIVDNDSVVDRGSEKDMKEHRFFRDIRLIMQAVGHLQFFTFTSAGGEVSITKIRPASRFLEGYLRDFTNITEQDFSEVYKAFRLLVDGKARKEIREIFMERFGKELKQEV
jgi:hypothetical protein